MPEVLRPLSFGDVLDGAFTLYRRNFAALFLTALLPQVPIVLFWLIVPSLVVGADPDGAMLAALPVLLTPYSLFAMILGMGALTHAAAEAYNGRTATVGAALGRGLRRWLPMAVAVVVAYIMIVIGLVLLIVPGLILLAMYFAFSPAIMLENHGPFSALGRSRQLSKGARGRILGILVVAWLIVLMPMLFAGVGIGVAGAADPTVFEGAGFTTLTQAGSAALGALTWPFLMAVTVLLYYDRRARTEAPDLEAAFSDMALETR